MHCQKASNILHTRERRHCEFSGRYLFWKLKKTQQKTPKTPQYNQTKLPHELTSCITLPLEHHHTSTFLDTATENYNLSGRLQDLYCMHMQAGASNSMPVCLLQLLPPHRRALGVCPRMLSAGRKDRSTSATEAGRHGTDFMWRWMIPHKV